MDKIKILREVGIRSDLAGSALLVLEAMFNEDYQSLDEFDDMNTHKDSLTVYMELCKVGFLTRQKNTNINFTLTKKGFDFASQLIVKDKPKAKMEDWISRYRELWINPKTGKYYTDPDGRVLGASENDLKARMSKFLVDYRGIFQDLPEGLTPEEIILKATQNHIDNAKKVSFAFCKDAFNFIYKQEGKTKDSNKSLLATACENFINSYNQEPTTKPTWGKSI